MDKIPDQVSEIIKANGPAMNQLGFGGVMGYCSGMAFRRVGRVVGVVIGVGFMGAQAAAASGYVDIDWNKVKDDAIKQIDTTGDGKFDERDAQEIWKKYSSAMTNQIPSAGGFTAGFLMGARRG